MRSNPTASALSRWRFRVFMENFATLPTWPRENKAILHLPGPAEVEKRMIKFDGYSYLQTVASHFCTHRKVKVNVALTMDQMRQLREIQWMDAYLAHIKRYHEKHGSRDSQPTTLQKVKMLSQMAAAPKKNHTVRVVDPELLPDGIEEYDFNGRRFLDMINPNWILAAGQKPKRIGVRLDDRQMRILMSVDWFYSYIWHFLRKKGIVDAGLPVNLLQGNLEDKDASDTESSSISIPTALPALRAPVQMCSLDMLETVLVKSHP